MMGLNELSAMQKKNLVNDLMAGKSPEVLAETYEVDIPPDIALMFVCPHCDHRFPMRVLTKDMQNLNQHVKCPSCRNGSYLSTINTPKKKSAHALIEGLGEWFQT